MRMALRSPEQVSDVSLVNCSRFYFVPRRMSSGGVCTQLSSVYTKSSKGKNVQQTYKLFTSSHACQKPKDCRIISRAVRAIRNCTELVFVARGNIIYRAGRGGRSAIRLMAAWSSLPAFAPATAILSAPSLPIESGSSLPV